MRGRSTPLLLLVTTVFVVLTAWIASPTQAADADDAQASSATALLAPAVDLVGDVNCDAIVNVIDALFVLQYDVELREGDVFCPPPTDFMFLPACDTNDDATCNVIDALFILQCDVGISNVLCPPP